MSRAGSAANRTLVAVCRSSVGWYWSTIACTCEPIKAALVGGISTAVGKSELLKSYTARDGEMLSERGRIIIIVIIIIRAI